MRDFVSCYSDHAVKVSDSSCTASAASVVSSSRALKAAPSAAARTAVTCVYRVRLSSTQREVVIKIIWSKPLIGHGFTISVGGGGEGVGGKESGSEDSDVRASASCSPSDDDDNNNNHLTVTKRKGSRCYSSADGSSVGLHWDLSSARYVTYGPEPIDSFYLAVVVDSELCLLLGDQAKKLDPKSWSSVAPAADCVLLSRREHVVVPPSASPAGGSPYTTRARFREGDREHEVSIKWPEPATTVMAKGPPDLGELAVFVDRKKVVHVRRLRWNFRGNQTIFVDGAPVDMMWDVHGWWFGGGGGGGAAVFMFRARSALESRLWLEEDGLSGELGSGGSSLVIHANKCL